MKKIHPKPKGIGKKRDDEFKSKEDHEKNRKRKKPYRKYGHPGETFKD